MRNYGVCDELCYKLPEQDFKLRWDLYSWPKKITDECVELEEKCIRLENKQQIEMEEAQAEVRESVSKMNLNFLLKRRRRLRESSRAPRHRRDACLASRRVS